jgi:hypothetical protein
VIAYGGSTCRPRPPRRRRGSGTPTRRRCPWTPTAARCDTSAQAFRDWLIERHGTLDALNDAWGTAFWSHCYSDWAQILPPRITPSYTNPGQRLLGVGA